jgi:hypothetical protein
MFKIKRWVTLMVMPYLLLPPQIFASTNDRPTKKMVYQELVEISESKLNRVAHLIPSGNIVIAQKLQQELTSETLRSNLAKLEVANSQELAAFKRELIKINEEELLVQTRELKGYLNALSDQEIDKLATRLSLDPQYQEENMVYQSAYTINEKRNVLFTALNRDLNFLRSNYNKKIGLFSRSDLQADLKRNLSLIEQNSNQKNQVKKVLQISLIALAGVALVTWGISSAVYGARLNRIEDQRINQLNDYKKELARQYNLYKDELTTMEMNYLIENGYVRTVCGTYQRPDSILCNRYDYQLFSGTKYCQVYCFKQAETGKETLHEAPVCTTPFVPADCYDPKEYWDAHARGKVEGYDAGYNRGWSDGNSDGNSDGRYYGDRDGDADGYNAGYNRGYNDGYAAGASAASKSNAFLLEEDQAYLDGYRDGLEQYQLIFLNY